MSRRHIQPEDRPMVAEFIERHWHSKLIMSRGKSYYPHEHGGIIEWQEDEIVGLVTFVREDDDLQLLTMNSTRPGRGIGSALLLMAIDHARQEGVSTVWLTTTNDNLRALGFYQRMGFRITAVNSGVVDEARKVKPEIPEVGEQGIPIHDEIVLELALKPCLHGEDGKDSPAHTRN